MTSAERTWFLGKSAQGGATARVAPLCESAAAQEVAKDARICSPEPLLNVGSILTHWSSEGAPDLVRQAGEGVFDELPKRASWGFGGKGVSLSRCFEEEVRPLELGSRGSSLARLGVTLHGTGQGERIDGESTRIILAQGETMALYSAQDTSNGCP